MVFNIIFNLKRISRIENNSFIGGWSSYLIQIKGVIFNHITQGYILFLFFQPYTIREQIPELKICQCRFQPIQQITNYFLTKQSL